MAFWQAPFDVDIEKATSENIPVGTEDVSLSIEIADKLKSKEYNPKNFLNSLKKRINHKNPNVQLLALNLTDICVKNSGQQFLVEVASPGFIDNLVSLAKSPTCNSLVQQKILSMIQSWSFAFTHPNLYYVKQTYTSLKFSGLKFPEISNEASSALFETQTAPEWTDSDICFRCRGEFNLINRKHHCRNCGRTFCGSCSTKSKALPWFGIQNEVRVCDECFLKRGPGLASIGSSIESSTVSSPKIVKPAVEDFPEDEIQKAIRLSLKDVQTFTPPVLDDDEDLRKAIENSLRDVENLNLSRESYRNNDRGYTGSGVFGGFFNEPKKELINETATIESEKDLSSSEMENLKLFSELVERMERQVEQQGIQVFSNNPQLPLLYGQISAVQSKLIVSLQDTSTRYRSVYELQEKLAKAIKTFDYLVQERINSSTYGSEYNNYPSTSRPVSYTPYVVPNASVNLPNSQMNVPNAPGNAPSNAPINAPANQPYVNQYPKNGPAYPQPESYQQYPTTNSGNAVGYPNQYQVPTPPSVPPQQFPESYQYQSNNNSVVAPAPQAEVGYGSQYSNNYIASTPSSGGYAPSASGSYASAPTQQGQQQYAEGQYAVQSTEAPPAVVKEVSLIEL